MVDATGMMETLRHGREEYSSSGDVAALAESVRLGRTALARLPGGAARQGAAANELAASLGVLYEATGDPGLLDEHLALLDRALALIPRGDPNLAPVHSNIAAGRLRRFFMRQNSGDLTAAIDAARQGIAVRRPDDPNLAGAYSNLAGALRMRYDVTGDPTALDESITAGRAAAAAIQAATHSQPLILASLAGSLYQRGLRMSSFADIQEGIGIARQAMALAPPASPWRRSAGSILAAALRANAQLTGDLRSLSAAIELHRENADLTPGQETERGLHLLQLAATLLVRYEWQEDRADLEAADDAARRALEPGDAVTAGEAWSLRATCWRYRARRLAADDDRAGAERAASAAVGAAEKSLALTDPIARKHSDNLLAACNALADRYELTGTKTHRAQAVAAYRDAIKSLDADSVNGQLAMLNLGRVLLRRTEDVRASLADIAAAMSLFRQVLTAAEPGCQRWGHACLGLIRALAQLFEIAPDDVDIEQLEGLYRHVTEASTVLPRQRAAAGMLAADVLLRTRRAEAAAWVLADVVRQLPRIAWRGTRRQTRESALAEFSQVGCDAAASQLAASQLAGGRGESGPAARAAEVLEQGRAVLWADTLQLRRGDAGLWGRQPDLAARLRDLAAILDGPETPLGGEFGDSRAVDHRMAASATWDELVDKARETIPDFLAPARLAELLPADALGPVVIVNVSRYRCDALIVTGESVRAVPLPSLSAPDISDRTVRYLEALTQLDADRATGGEDPEHALSEVLEWLWDTVAGPVLAALGIRDAPAPGEPWPRIWWCPTGPLSLLPLHAAGYHASPPAAGAPPRTVLDRAISSYTPTLGALADARQQDADQDASQGSLLFVGVPDPPGAPGMPSLPGASDERALLSRKLGARCHALDGASATVAAVRAALPGHRWVHFSCHGRQDLASPSSGGLRLWDGTLTVTAMGAQRQRGEFAFLAACQTATGGATLANEAISLAAAIHYAGYRHVVATLWSTNDFAAAEVARVVYDDLAASGRLTPARSAQALHTAIRHLRDTDLTRPSWWIPFVHIGP